MKSQKPKLSVDEQIKHLQDKGIQFNEITIEEAKSYLTENNNFFKLSAYRKNYPKYQGGTNDGKYIDLDFAYLKDLAIIDMKLRYTFLHLCLDVEHFTKISLLRIVDKDDNEDGYSIITDYINSLNETQKASLENEINRNVNNIYCGEIVNKYQKDYPIWAFLEIIPFGRLVSFYQFCAERFSDKVMTSNYFILLTCKEIRNACAHSNCILNELSSNTQKHNTSYRVMKELSTIPALSSTTRKRKMSNAHLQQIVTLLYFHKKIVTSQGVHDAQAKQLHLLIDRMFKNIQYYDTNENIKTSFEFLKRIIDNWFKTAYTNNT